MHLFLVFIHVCNVLLFGLMDFYWTCVCVFLCYVFCVEHREGDYAELQIGVAPTQMQSFPLPAKSINEWTEWALAFKGNNAHRAIMNADMNWISFVVHVALSCCALSCYCAVHVRCRR